MKSFFGVILFCLSLNPLFSGVVSELREKEKLAEVTSHISENIKPNLEALKKDKNKVDRVVQNLSLKQRELFKKLSDEEQKKIMDFLLDIKKSNSALRMFSGANSNSTLSDKVFILLSKLTSKTSILCATSIVVGFIVKGIINSDGLDRLMSRIITIYNRQIALLSIGGFCYFLSFLGYVLTQCKDV